MIGFLFCFLIYKTFWIIRKNDSSFSFKQVFILFIHLWRASYFFYILHFKTFDRILSSYINASFCKMIGPYLWYRVKFVVNAYQKKLIVLEWIEHSNGKYQNYKRKCKTRACSVVANTNLYKVPQIITSIIYIKRTSIITKDTPTFVLWYVSERTMHHLLPRHNFDGICVYVSFMSKHDKGVTEQCS